MGIKIEDEKYTEEQLVKSIMSGTIITGKVSENDMNKITKEKEDKEEKGEK